MYKVSDAALTVAIFVAESALTEAENAKMQHLAGIANRKLVIMPLKELRALTEAGHELLQDRGRE